MTTLGTLLIVLMAILLIASITFGAGFLCTANELSTLKKKYDNKCDELKRNAAEHTATIRNYNSRLQTAENSRNSISARLTATEKQSTHNAVLCAEAQAEKQQLQEQLTARAVALEDFAAKFNEKDARLQELQLEYNHVKQNALTVAEQLECLRRENEELKSFVRQREIRIDELVQESQSRDAELDRLQSDFRQREESRDAELVRRDEIENNLKRDSAKLMDGMDAALRESQSEIAKRDELLLAAKRENANLHLEIGKLTDIKGDTERSIAERDELIGELTAALKTAESNLANLTTQLKEAAKALAPLRSLLFLLSQYEIGDTGTCADFAFEPAIDQLRELVKGQDRCDVVCGNQEIVTGMPAEVK